MPKSKRNRQVTTSNEEKKKKKQREHKEKIIMNVRIAAEIYNSAYVFTFENIRNSKYKVFTAKLKSNSRFFLGKNKVMQVALGRSESDEVRPGIHKIYKFIRSDAGLVFTDLPKEDVEKHFREYEESGFAKTGSIASETVELKEGPLEQFSHDMEPYLRKQGMPVKLNREVIELVADYVVCEEGKPVSPQASRILRLLDVKLSTFKLNLVCRWSPGDFELYTEPADGSDTESS